MPPKKVDAYASASVVTVDAKSAAELRDRVAREQLSKQASYHDRETLSLSGIQNTMPYSLRVCVSMRQTDKCSRDDITLRRKNHYENIQSILQSGFDMCTRYLNEFEPTSEVSQINSAPAGKTFQLSEHLNNIIALGVRTNRSSGGTFDLGYPVLMEYLVGIASRHGGRIDGDRMTESEHQQAETLAHDFNFDHAFAYDEAKKTISKKSAKARIGIAAISKGYVVDYVVEALKAHACENYGNCLFEWAGDIRGSGTNEQNCPWSVGIVVPPTLDDIRAGRKPHLDPSTRKYLRVCTLDNAAIATSGDYEYLIAGSENNTTHLCLMKSAELIVAGKDKLAQVSVVSTSCAVADVLATTILLKQTISNARWWLTQWRSVKHPVMDYTFYVREGEIVARKHEVAIEAPELRQARIANNLPARVIVVGGGLAGLSAAVEAASCGASVIIMEKMPELNGNSSKATSGINGWGTRMQGLHNIEDDGRYFERDTFLSGKGGVTDVGLVKMLSTRSKDALHWLAAQTSLDLSVVSQLGGHSRPRTHRVPDTPTGEPVPVGWVIMQRMKERIRAGDFKDKITVMTNTHVTSLVSTSSVGPDHIRRTNVSGVRFVTKDDVSEAAGAADREEQLNADAVILTTGGFGNDHKGNSLLAEYAPDLVNLPTTNGSFATGDGVKMAREIGASLQDMDKVQLHPTGFIDPTKPDAPTKYLGPEALRGSGGILVSSKGERFTDELGLRSVVSAAIKALGDVYPDSNNAPFAHCILNKHAIKLFGPAQLSFYRDTVKLFRSAATIDELAKLIACDPATLKKTFADYAAATTAGRCKKTGKGVFPCEFSGTDADGPFVVGLVTPSIHYTMGGVAISPAAEVQVIDHDEEDQTTSGAKIGRHRPIKGLFAAGEVTSGVHGANRLGGNSLLECVVFGRIAGDRAASMLQRHRDALNPHTWTWVTVREVREGSEFGRGSLIIRFNLPGAAQNSGLQVGHYVSIRGEWEGKSLLGHYSPVTLPNDSGVIGLLVRVDKGPLKDWLSALQPGHAIEMKSGGGIAIDRNFQEKVFCFSGRPVRRLSLIAGGSGIAPHLSFIRAALKQPFRDGMDGIRLVYASETADELTYLRVLQGFAKSSPKFKFHIILNNPPAGWTGGVGFVDAGVMRNHLFPPGPDNLVVICGPPVMQAIVKKVLITVLKHDANLVKTVDEQMKPTRAKL